MNFTNAILIIIFIGFTLGYLFGNLLWSVILGKIFFHKDVREFESGNAGATNSARVYGKKFAVVVLILDILKCYIPTMIMWLITRYTLNNFLIVSESFNPYTLLYLTSLGSVIGHCYPVFFQFKGGKGASCFGAFLWCISPWIAIIQLSIFILLIKQTKYVSLSSIISSLTCWILLFIPGINWMYMQNTDIVDLYIINNFGIYWVLATLAFLAPASFIVIFKHRSNIVRLLKGEERKIGFSKA